MKKTIVVTKAGVTMRVRSMDHPSSSMHTLGEIEGLLRHLVADPRWDVVYFGRWDGPGIDGVRVVEPHVKGFDEFTTLRMQKTGFAQDEAQLEALPFWDPLCMVEFTGMPTSTGFIDNPTASAPAAMSVRYVAPALHVLERYGLPRFLVNNDVRSYPRNQEMSWGYEWTRPLALLDQTEMEKRVTVGRKPFIRRSVMSKTESWTWTPEVKDAEKNVPACVVAHCYVHSKYHGRDKRASAFDAILSPAADAVELMNEGVKVYGRDWEHYHRYDAMRPMFAGSVSLSECARAMAASKCCPCVAPGPNFVTNKIHFLASQRCVPLLFGDGEHPLTYDALEQYLPLDSDWRVVKSGDFKRRVDELRDETTYNNEMSYWRTVARPDFSLVDAMLGELFAGADPRSDGWHDKYGGYRPG